jgi:serine/threonine protein kinase
VVDSQRTLLQRRPADRQPPLLDRYRLLDTLGEGGFGTVWRAHDEQLHRDVAVKRIAIGPDGHSQRAAREAKATARLKHPAIVALYEAVLHDDAFYLISELVEGQTLARLIADDQMTDEQILEIGIALADALAHAHARGVIHRDIKPQNVLVPDEPENGHGVAKLTDFGGASMAGEDILTRAGDVYGTLAYMAPEQADGHEATEPADLYSLALVLYEAFSGVNPVRGATPAATARRIGRPLEPLARHRRDLPRALTHALDIALAPDPERRGTLDRLRLALAQAHERGLSRSRWSRPSSPQPAREPSAERTIVDAAPARRRSPLAQPPRPFEPAAAPPHQPAEDPHEQDAVAPARRLLLPRSIWLAGALAAAVWQAVSGRPGVSLLILAALLPLLVLPGEPRSSRLGARWLACVLAPLLGLVSLAGAFPAIAGQGVRWRERAAYGALGYWWLCLAEPLLARRLWLGPPSGSPARSAWEGSLGLTASHVIAPLLTLGVLLGALLWGCASLLLPWIVRGRRAALDMVALLAWSLALALGAPLLDSGLAAHAAHQSPHGLVLGAIVGGMVALAARALRGPV